jgi:hypothetical protein
MFLLSPNADAGVPTVVHIDEIVVPESLRKRGVGTNAMVSLCKLANKYQFRLEGGPIGWSECPWRDKFIEWMFRFGFASDLSSTLPFADNPGTFFVRRMPNSE